MMVGLFFFIRASVKDRTKQIKLIPSDSEDILLEKLQKYFESRAYQLVAIDAEQERVTFRGFVRPSMLLAVLLTILAAFGLSCLALILYWLLPGNNSFLWLLLLLSPVAGIFYWRKAGRWEEILLQVVLDENNANSKIVKVTAHRDELIQLQKNMALQVQS